MKCAADFVFVCDKEIECKCGFCKEHCICEFLETQEGKLFIEKTKKELNTFFNKK